MSQYDVLEFLKTHIDRWFTAKDLNKVFRFHSAQHNLRRLKEHGLVFCRRKSRRIGGNIYYYRYKEGKDDT